MPPVRLTVTDADLLAAMATVTQGLTIRETRAKWQGMALIGLRMALGLHFPDLTPNQAAKWLGAHPNSVRNWLRAGRFPGHYRLAGNRIRIPIADLEALKRRNRPHA